MCAGSIVESDGDVWAIRLIRPMEYFGAGVTLGLCCTSPPSENWLIWFGPMEYFGSRSSVLQHTAGHGQYSSDHTRRSSGAQDTSPNLVSNLNVQPGAPTDASITSMPHPIIHPATNWQRHLAIAAYCCYKAGIYTLNACYFLLRAGSACVAQVTRAFPRSDVVQHWLLADVVGPLVVPVAPTRPSVADLIFMDRAATMTTDGDADDADDEADSPAPANQNQNQADRRREQELRVREAGRRFDEVQHNRRGGIHRQEFGQE